MFIPYISEPTRKLFIRKGGGGGGHGGGGGGGGRGGGGARGSGGSVAAGTTVKGQPNFSGASRAPVSITSGGQNFKATPFSNGGGPKSTIPPQQPFGGREVGGGTRGQVYGTSTYGSGYPGVAGRGVAGRGFPFAFYPVVFLPPLAIGAGAPYLYNSEYGRPDNTSRPGGPLQEISIASNVSTFHIIADNATITYLHSAIPTSCNSAAVFQLSLPQAYNASGTPSVQPEQAIQYYRASSVVLTLDGYNNTAALGSDESTPPTPLPSNIDTNLMMCVNRTIGSSVPLVGGGMRTSEHSSALIFLLFWVIWFCNTL